MVQHFSGKKTAEIVGITYRQLDYWARTNLVRPSVTDAAGSGSRRTYSYRDLLELKVIKRLLDADVSLRSARRALEVLRGSGAEVATANLVLNGTQSILAHSGEEIIDLLKGGQGVLNIVALAGVVRELDAAITDLAPAPEVPVAVVVNAEGEGDGSSLARSGSGG